MAFVYVCLSKSVYVSHFMNFVLNSVVWFLVDGKDTFSIHIQQNGYCCPITLRRNGSNSPGDGPTNGISIEFVIRSEFWYLHIKICSTDHNEMLHTSRQLHCRDVWRISSWLVEFILNKNTANFVRISNSIEISLVGRGHGIDLFQSNIVVWTPNGLFKYNLYRVPRSPEIRLIYGLMSVLSFLKLLITLKWYDTDWLEYIQGTFMFTIIFRYKKNRQ